MEEGEEGETRNRPNPQKKKVVIQIPSYQEVIESSQNPSSSSSSSSSSSLPSQTFSQAFNFVRNSEFYSPPPPIPALTPNRTPSISASPQPQPGNATQSVPPRPASVASTSSQAVQSRHAILVSHRQKGNPLLKHIRNIRWAFADVVCDYLLGQNSCALYLSLRYHLLHPDYLYFRIRELQKNYRLRVILCHVDVDDVVKPLLEVTKTALLHDCTLLCAWSLEECGRYLETIKMYENKPADLIQGQMDADYLSRLNHVLTSVRRVNKTDVVTLGSTFGTLSHIMDASMEDLARCPGIGERKVKRLYDTFHEPFKRVVSSNTTVSDSPVPAGSEPSSNNEGAEADKEDDASKRQKKEPVVTVKSALSAASAKYAYKFGKMSNSKGDTGIESENKLECGESTSG